MFTGYQFAPVLTEQELLTLHSPEIFQNVFKTSIQVTVANDENGDVKFIFKNVIEVNDFISNACNHSKAQTLGELKFNVRKYKLKPDEDKKFNLQSKDPEAMLEQYSNKHNFRVKNDRVGLRTLSFQEKIERAEASDRPWAHSSSIAQWPVVPCYGRNADIGFGG